MGTGIRAMLPVVGLGFDAVRRYDVAGEFDFLCDLQLAGVEGEVPLPRCCAHFPDSAIGWWLFDVLYQAVVHDLDFVGGIQSLQ